MPRLPGNFVGVEVVRPACGDLAGRLVGVVGESHAVGHVGDAVVAGEALEDLVPRDEVVVERLEQVLVRLEPEVVADVDDVPGDLAGLDLGLDRRVRGVLVLGELDAGQLRVRLQPGFPLRLLVGTAERDVGQGDAFLAWRIAGFRGRPAARAGRRPGRRRGRSPTTTSRARGDHRQDDDGGRERCPAAHARTSSWARRVLGPTLLLPGRCIVVRRARRNNGEPRTRARQSERRRRATSESIS